MESESGASLNKYLSNSELRVVLLFSSFLSFFTVDASAAAVVCLVSKFDVVFEHLNKGVLECFAFLYCKIRHVIRAY